MTIRICATALVCLSLASASSAQTPRDAVGAPRPAAAPSVSAALTGTVADASADARPVRRALVTVRSASDAVREEHASTDDAGRFSVAGLPPGYYLVGVTKPGYVDTSYGATSPLAPGIPVALTADGTANVSVRLQKGAVITGVTRGCGGWAGAGRVTAFRLATIGGARRLVQVGASSGVDERGVYRIWGLPAGEYIIQSAPGTIVGTETRLITPAEVAWASGASGGTAAPGTTANREVPARGRPIAVSPCYFPGTADEGAAQLVRVGAGEERDGIDFEMGLVAAATVTGVVLDPGGTPATNVQIALVRRTPLRAALPAPPVRMEGEGRFSVGRIAAGSYALMVHTTSGPPAFASVDLAIDTQDVGNVEVRLQPGSTVTGRVTFNGQPVRPESVAGLSVKLEPVNVDNIVAPAPAAATVNANGTFVVTGVAPGRYRLSATGAAGNWVLQSAALNGVDSQDTPVDIRAGQDVGDATLVFGEAAGAVSGTLVDGAGRPARGYSLVLFSTDTRFWQSSPRRVRIATPATNGAYTFAPLPPGEYYLAATTDLTPEQIIDPMVLDALTSAALRVGLTLGEKRTQDIRLSGR